jgi:threonine aldolase
MPSSRISDFRSDTVTRPTPAMRRAMAEAPVGDDVFGDDPTVKELESRAAALLGTEAAVFCPTGTMANQVAIRCHTQRGDEVLLHDGCHAFRFEQGGMAALHGVQARALPGPRGEVPVDVLEAEIRGDDQHFPRTRLIVLENTFNWGGGAVLGRAYVRAVIDLARRRRLAVHLDGARLMNAAAASRCAPSELASGADSVTLCLSKGLGAPAGTVLGSSGRFVAEARRARKLLGGGMRQAGVLAAAGLLAITDPPDLLADHARAARLAEAIRGVPGATVDPAETNMVVVTVAGRTPASVLESMKAEGVLAVGFGAGRIRFVTHRDVGDEDVGRAAAAFAKAMGRA